MITGPASSVAIARKLRRAMSLPEVLLWRELRKRPAGLKFRRQHAAGHYVLDFYCAKAKLAVEVDGKAHDCISVRRKDANRSAFLKSRGVATLRVPAEVVLKEIEVAVTRIVEVCVSRSTEPLHRPADGPPPRAGEDFL